MAQTFTSTEVVTTTNVFADNQSQRTNENTLRSSFSGDTQPSNPVVGQVWYDTANSKQMQYNGTAWVSIDTNGVTQKDVTNAKGNLTSLTDYLRVAHNDDGTLKTSPATAIDEFKDNTLAITYVSTSSFTVPTDLTSIFTTNRKVKVYLDGSTVISYVSSSSYDGGANKTTVVLGDNVLNSSVTAVKYSVIQYGMPQDYNLSLEESTGYGVISGGSATVSGLIVTITAVIAHMPNGNRYSLPQSTITVNAADVTNPRIDLIYLSSAGVVSYLAGTAAVSPTVPSVPTGGLALHKALIGIDGTVALMDLRGFKARYQNMKEVNVLDFGAVGDGIADDTNAFTKAVAYCSANGYSLRVPALIYVCHELVFEYPIEILCDRGTTFNVSSLLFNIKSNHVVIRGNPVLNIASTNTFNAVEFNAPTVQTDTAIQKCDIELSVIGTQQGITTTNVTAFCHNYYSWNNDIKINSLFCAQTFNFTGNFWANSDRYKASIMHFANGVIVQNSSTLMACDFDINAEQGLSSPSPSYLFRDMSTGASCQHCNLNLVHWLDNYNGKVYVVSFEHSESRGNKVTGHIEGLINDAYSRNLFECYYTRRDRSVTVNDQIGTHNVNMKTTHAHKNLLPNGDFECFSSASEYLNASIGTVGSVSLAISTVNYHSGLQSMQILKTDNADSWMTMTVENGHRYAGRIIGLACWCKCPTTNKRNDYTAFLNDGATSGGTTGIPNDGIWHRVVLFHTVSTSATTLQVNIGRRSGASNSADGTGDVVLVDDVIVYENDRQYEEQEFIPAFYEKPVTLSALPATAPTVKDLHKLFIITAGDPNFQDQLYYVAYDGFTATYKYVSISTSAGATANRPTTNLYVGKMYYDASLQKPIWYSTSGNWKDANGTAV